MERGGGGEGLQLSSPPPHHTPHHIHRYLAPCDTSPTTVQPPPSYDNGRLHLVFESGPLSFVMEQAGGKASTGQGRLLDVTPQHIREQTPVFMGSPEDVRELEAVFERGG